MIPRSLTVAAPFIENNPSSRYHRISTLGHAGKREEALDVHVDNLLMDLWITHLRR